ncbi:MAG: molybdopterin-synthase adenylyltransferase MoeB [Bacteroidia bacterium]
MLDKNELVRYSRHILLSEIGTAGQEKLKNAKVLVIGAGGLGCPVLLYLTAGGVGEIGIVDFDKIDASNLQRQVLYTVDDIGRLKAETAAAKLAQQNPYVKFTVFTQQLTTQNALEIINQYAIIVDGTDNFSTRYMVNDACVLLNKPLVYGAIYRFEGQVSVFNYKVEQQEQGPTYRCLFPVPPGLESTPNCSEIGVLGVLPGMIGTMQAAEVIKMITGIGTPLSGRLLLLNALTMDVNTLEIKRTCETIKGVPTNAEEFRKADYAFFCGDVPTAIKSINAKQLLVLLKEKDKLQLLDVRNSDEEPVINDFFDLQIPFGDLLDEVEKLSRTKQVVVFCKSGMRSKRAIEILQKEFQFNNLYHLEEGLMGWIQGNQLT